MTELKGPESTEKKNCHCFIFDLYSFFIMEYPSFFDKVNLHLPNDFYLLTSVFDFRTYQVVMALGVQL